MMTKREFLKNFATLGIASPFIVSLLSSCRKDELFFQDIDVNFNGKILVIGAGAAGITAGHILNKQGIDFQILEASPIHGGRVKKAPDFVDFPIDLGAEWIHTDPSILAKLNNAPQSNVDIDIITYNPKTISVWKNDKLRKRNIASNFYSEYKFKNSTWFDFFDQLMIPEIKDRIVYNSPVTEIDMPDGLKVFIEFSEKFYPDMVMLDNLLEGAINGEHTYYDAAFEKDTDNHVFALFAVGDKATKYTSLETDEAIFNKVMEELDAIFDGKASQFYMQHIVQNWSKEAFIQGSYSHGWSSPEVLASPVNNRLFFAGEAMATNGNTSTVHGASESAYAMIEMMLTS